MIRVWRPAGEGVSVSVPLRGLVEHVQSGRSDSFQGEEHLIELIRADLAGMVESEREGGS